VAWHNALDLVTAALLLAIGAPLLWAAWRAKGSGPRSHGSVNTDTTTSLLLIAACLSFAAAAIHIAVVPEHLTESAVEGVAFALLALFQITTGALLAVGPSDRLKAAVVAVNLGATLMWMITRTIGVPFISDIVSPEAIALRDVVATTFELGIVAVLLGISRAAANADRFASMAAVSLVPVLGLVGIITLLAVAGPTPVHEHATLETPAGLEGR
jgi:hypothetical protein